MSNTTIVPSTAGPGPSGRPSSGGGGSGGGCGTEQMRTLFGFLGKMDEPYLFPSMIQTQQLWHHV
uniref:Uncharacterized protein n=1 Tax=Colobus angolensis palliatus TaxID=336983 RepID=A0A2K5KE95_COLAP